GSSLRNQTSANILPWSSVTWTAWSLNKARTGSASSLGGSTAAIFVLHLDGSAAQLVAASSTSATVPQMRIMKLLQHERASPRDESRGLTITLIAGRARIAHLPVRCERETEAVSAHFKRADIGPAAVAVAPGFVQALAGESILDG